MFRASISAFCSLARPTKREITQLDDLTTPLLPLVNAASRRFASAALSECLHPPQTLVHLLAEQPVEISAPLLVRSPALSDVDLITLISRHGWPHAQAIARRDNLHPTIATLIRALQAGRKETVPMRQKAGSTDGTAAESVRSRLRAIMRFEAEQAESRLASEKASTVYDRLRNAALTGVNELFEVALGEPLQIPAPSLRSLLRSGDDRHLLRMLRLMQLSEEQAYLIVSALQPGSFSHAEAIRLFLERYGSISAEDAERHFRIWKADATGVVVGMERRGDIRTT